MSIRLYLTHSSKELTQTQFEYGFTQVEPLVIMYWKYYRITQPKSNIIQIGFTFQAKTQPKLNQVQFSFLLDRVSRVQVGPGPVAASHLWL